MRILAKTMCISLTRLNNVWDGKLICIHNCLAERTEESSASQYFQFYGYLSQQQVKPYLEFIFEIHFKFLLARSSFYYLYRDCDGLVSEIIGSLFRNIWYGSGSWSLDLYWEHWIQNPDPTRLLLIVQNDRLYLLRRERFFKVLIRGLYILEHDARLHTYLNLPEGHPG